MDSTKLSHRWASDSSSANVTESSVKSPVESGPLPTKVGAGPLKNEPNSGSEAKGAFSSTNTNESPEDEQIGDEAMLFSIALLVGITIGSDFCLSFGEFVNKAVIAFFLVLSIISSPISKELNGGSGNRLMSDSEPKIKIKIALKYR